MRRLSLIGLSLFLSQVIALKSEELILKAIPISEQEPVKKAMPSAAMESTANKNKIDSSVKKNDFKVNLFEQQSHLRKSGGTPPIIRQKRLYGRIIPEPKFFWKADETKPLTKLVIKLEEQKIFGFQDSILVMESDISSGREAFATKPGSYTVLQKDKDHKSNLFGSHLNSKGKLINSNAEEGKPIPEGLHYVPASMPYYLRLSYQGLGLHAGILPGYPASHGCIRLPPSIAEKLFSAVPLDTPVEVFP